MIEIHPSLQKIGTAPVTIQIIGAVDFTRRTGAALRTSFSDCTFVAGNLAEAWGSMLTAHPHIVVLEIGPQYSERAHASAKTLLERARERFDKQTYIIAALAAPERLFFGGDLLFRDSTAFSPSSLIDMFVALPPGAIPSVPSLSQQLVHAIALAISELDRRQRGLIALPALADEGWVQSLADPHSRELWMRWLPRYASYTNENPLIVGDTGTGKTNLAYALHRLSGRKGQFVSITPRDFSSSELVQAELFGAVQGAYTGAVDKWGLVKGAEKGTLFIDELQSIDKELQGKLITFIENKSYRRVGSAESTSADVRFVFASNRSLYDMMEHEVLRHDFAYRLERVLLDVRPLALRRLDICAALAFALAKVRRQRPHAQPVAGFTSAAYRILFSQRWPGNLRQLENRVAQLCELADMDQVGIIDERMVAKVFETQVEGMVVTSSDVVTHAAKLLSEKSLGEEVSSLEGGVTAFVKLARDIALESCGGDSKRAAELLGDDAHILSLLSSLGVAAAQGRSINRVLKRGGSL